MSYCHSNCSKTIHKSLLYLNLLKQRYLIRLARKRYVIVVWTKAIDLFLASSSSFLYANHVFVRFHVYNMIMWIVKWIVFCIYNYWLLRGSWLNYRPKMILKSLLHSETGGHCTIFETTEVSDFNRDPNKITWNICFIYQVLKLHSHVR